MPAKKKPVEPPLTQFVFAMDEVSQIQALSDLRKDELLVFTKAYPETAYADGLHRLGRIVGVDSGAVRIQFADCVIATSAPVGSFLKYEGDKTELSLWGGRFPWIARKYAQPWVEREAEAG